MVDSNEDLLDLFASVALVGAMQKTFNGEQQSEARMDNVSRACYAQAQSMLRVRKEFLNDTRPDYE